MTIKMWQDLCGHRIIPRGIADRIKAIEPEPMIIALLSGTKPKAPIDILSCDLGGWDEGA